jgi:hypothetical protein
MKNIQVDNKVMKSLGFPFLRTGRNGTGDFSWGTEHPVGGKARKYRLFEEKTDSGTTLLGFQG